MIRLYLIEFWSLVMRTMRAGREMEGKKGSGERLKKKVVEREGKACYFTAVWKIWLT